MAAGQVYRLIRAQYAQRVTDPNILGLQLAGSDPLTTGALVRSQCERSGTSQRYRGRPGGAQWPQQRRDVVPLQSVDQALIDHQPWNFTESTATWQRYRGRQAFIPAHLTDPAILNPSLPDQPLLDLVPWNFDTVVAAYRCRRSASFPSFTQGRRILPIGPYYYPTLVWRVLDIQYQNPDQASYSSITIAPTPGSTLLVSTFISAASVAGTPTVTDTLSGGTLPWITKHTQLDGGRATGLFVARVGLTPGTGTLTISGTGGDGTWNGAGWAIIEVLNTDSQNPLPQFAFVGGDGTSSTNPTATVGSVIGFFAGDAVSNRVFSFWSHRTNEVTDPRPNYTELGDTPAATPAMGWEVQVRDDGTNEQNGSASWATSSRFAGYTVEIAVTGQEKAYLPSAGAAPLQRYRGRQWWLPSVYPDPSSFQQGLPDQPLIDLVPWAQADAQAAYRPWYRGRPQWAAWPVLARDVVPLQSVDQPAIDLIPWEQPTATYQRWRGRVWNQWPVYSQDVTTLQAADQPLLDLIPWEPPTGAYLRYRGRPIHAQWPVLARLDPATLQLPDQPFLDLLPWVPAGATYARYRGRQWWLPSVYPDPSLLVPTLPDQDVNLISWPQTEAAYQRNRARPQWQQWPVFSQDVTQLQSVDQPVLDLLPWLPPTATFQRYRGRPIHAQWPVLARMDPTLLQLQDQPALDLIPWLPPAAPYQRWRGEVLNQWPVYSRDVTGLMLADQPAGDLVPVLPPAAAFQRYRGEQAVGTRPVISDPSTYPTGLPDQDVNLISWPLTTATWQRYRGREQWVQWPALARDVTQLQSVDQALIDLVPWEPTTATFQRWRGRLWLPARYPDPNLYTGIPDQDVNLVPVATPAAARYRYRGPEAWTRPVVSEPFLTYGDADPNLVPWQQTTAAWQRNRARAQWAQWPVQARDVTDDVTAVQALLDHVPWRQTIASFLRYKGRQQQAQWPALSRDASFLVGDINLALSKAIIVLSGRPLTLSPGAISLSLGTGTVSTAARPVGVAPGTYVTILVPGVVDTDGRPVLPQLQAVITITTGGMRETPTRPGGMVSKVDGEMVEQPRRQPAGMSTRTSSAGMRDGRKVPVPT